MSTQQDARDSVDRFLAWPAVVVANAIIPLIIALRHTTGGRWGIVLGIAFFCISGSLAIKRFPKLWPIMVWGGMATALTQFCPVIQMVAGMLALDLIAKGHFATEEFATTVLTEMGGFLATAFTGALILILPMVLGLIIQVVQSSVCPDNSIDGVTTSAHTSQGEVS